MPFTRKQRDRFALMFYQWSHARTLEELASDFESVRRARVFTYTHIETMSRTSPADRKSTAIARLKQIQPRGAKLNGEPLSRKEKALLERFEILRNEVLAEESARAFLEPGPPTEGPTGLRGILELQPPALIGPRQGDAQVRRRLVKSLKKELPDVLGEIAEDDARDWTHRREIQGHVVSTWCDATGPKWDDDFNYRHCILDPETGGEPLASWVSWLSWLGIIAVSKWRLNDEEEIPLVIEAVKNASRQFFEALPAMLPIAR